MLRNLFGRKSSSSEREIHVGAFGKHPGWNDHIDDIGLETERLVGVKRVLYVEGIGANIDSGAWDKLDESKRLEGFAHVFAWRTGAGGGGAGDVVVGRLWSSRDGKGRAKYPMVVAAHCRGVPVRWAIETVLPQLERAQGLCTATESAAEVVGIIDGVRRELRAAMEGVDKGGPELVSPRRVVGRIANDPGMAAGREGVARVLYQIEREMGAYLAGGAGGKSRLLDMRPQQIRVPACAASATEALLQWMQFMYLRLDGAAPVMVIAPDVGAAAVEASSGEARGGWVDVLVGPVQGSQMFCLRASLKAAPLTSEIPYSLDDGFRVWVEKVIETAEGEVEVGRRR